MLKSPVLEHKKALAKELAKFRIFYDPMVDPLPVLHASQNAIGEEVRTVEVGGLSVVISEERSVQVKECIANYDRDVRQSRKAMGIGGKKRKVATYRHMAGNWESQEGTDSPVAWFGTAMGIVLIIIVLAFLLFLKHVGL